MARTSWRGMSHAEELLRAFRVGAEDLVANRAGRLGAGQVRRMRRGIGQNVVVTVVIVGGLLGIFYFVAARPFAWYQYTIVGVLAVAGGATGYVGVRGLRRALRAGVVAAYAGPVQRSMRGRNGWWITVQDHSFRLPVAFWHIGDGAYYHVYVAPAAKLVVAMEPGRPPATAALDAEVLRDWCERLCAHPSAHARAAVEDLGIPGSLTEHFSSMILEPPPPGTTRFVVDEREGEWFTVKLALDGAAITQVRLTESFGPGKESVRVHWDSPHAIGYRVEAEDAPFSCDLFAYYDGAPDDSSVPDEVLIRRQRVMRAPRKKMPG